MLEFIVKNGEEIKLYSVDTIDKKETVPTNAYVVNDQSALDTANNSITYIQNFIKSKLVEKHNEDYKESLKQSKKNKKVSKDKGKKTGEKLYCMLVNQLSCSMFDNWDYLKARIAGNSKDEILSQIASDYGKFKYFRI